MTKGSRKTRNSKKTPVADRSSSPTASSTSQNDQLETLIAAITRLNNRMDAFEQKAPSETLNATTAPVLNDTSGASHVAQQAPNPVNELATASTSTAPDAVARSTETFTVQRTATTTTTTVTTSSCNALGSHTCPMPQLISTLPSAPLVASQTFSTSFSAPFVSQTTMAPTAPFPLSALRANLAEADFKTSFASQATLAPSATFTPLVAQTTAPAPFSSPSATQTSLALAPQRHSATTRSHCTITRYNGSDAKLRSPAWLAVYKDFYEDLDDCEKRHDLAGFLTGDALEWYASEVAGRKLDWHEVKRRFLARFGTATVHPIAEAELRRKRRDEDVKTYALDKQRLCRAAGIPDDCTLALLTSGLPPVFRTTFVGARPKTFDDWLEIAYGLEHEEKRQTRSRRPGAFAVLPNKNGKPQKGGDRSKLPLPKTPCRICEKRGISNAMHWHRRCPYNTWNDNNNGHQPPRNDRRRDASPDLAAALDETLNSSGGHGSV